MIPQDTRFQLTDDDNARLQPIVADIGQRLDRGVEQICRLTGNAGEQIEMLQGFCEALAERMREMILKQVDRGEWATRGINTRDDVSITISVDAARGVLDGTDLMHLEFVPVWALS